MMRKLSGFHKILFQLGLCAVGVFFIVGGVVGIRQDNTFLRTTAVIRSIELVSEADSAEDTDEYAVMVEYSADGKTYVSDLGTMKKDFAEGKEIEILYDPSNPEAIVLPGKTGPILMIVLGAAAAIGAGIALIESRRAEETDDWAAGSSAYAPSVQGEERSLYFLSDTGTMKIGHRLEDADRKVLYEAKVTKFTLLRPTEMEFIDGRTGVSSQHGVGHEVTTEYSSILVDTHSTFTLDGEDIWKHLKRNGITVESGFAEGKILFPQYRIFRDGREIALVTSSSRFVHEEDDKGGIGSKVPVRGFYRIRTREVNLDLLFVTVMAFARTSANDANGGNFGMLFGKKG